MKVTCFYISWLLLCGVLCSSCGSRIIDKFNVKDSEEYNDYDDEDSSHPRITSKPDANRMASDLIGCTISEGYENGYHPADWTFTIERGQIQDFEILDVLIDQPDLYVVEVNMKLKPDASFYYDTFLKINYRNSPSEGWIIDNIMSQGMDVVSNGAYDDCVRLRIDEDGWGGTKGLYVRNNSNSSLIVGGKLLNNDGWTRFSVGVEPHEESMTGGLFGGGSVRDYCVDFVVKQF